MAKTDLTAQHLRELLNYDPETGVFTWLARTARHTRIGGIAGSKNSGGYLRFKIDSVTYRSHRLAWLYVHGSLPANQIDHIDGNRTNNRIDNLRDASQNVNQQNQRLAKTNNKLGLLGVSRSRKGFRAQIRIDGNVRHIGMFSTPELAYAAYLSAKRVHHEGCTI